MSVVAHSFSPAIRCAAQGFSLAILVATSALAQDAHPRAEAPIHIGPLYITPVLQLTRLGVDTNVFNSSSDPQSDFTVAGGPKIDVAVPLSRFLFTASTVTDFVYYRRFKNQRGLNFDLDLRAEARLGRLTTFFEDAFLNTRERPNFEIDVRARRRENEARAGLSIDIFRKLEVELAVSQGVTEYDGADLIGASLAQTLNRDSLAANGSIRYTLTPLTSVALTGETKIERFAFSPSRDNESWSIVPGVEFHPRAIISGNADVGYRNVRGLDASLPSFAGLVASVDLSYRFLGSTVANFTASRNIDYSLELLDPYYVAEGFGSSVRRRLSKAFDMTVGTQWFANRYRRFGLGPPDSSLADRVDTIRNVSVALHRRLTRDTEIGLELSYWSRRTNRSTALGYDGLIARSYDGLMVRMTAVYPF